MRRIHRVRGLAALVAAGAALTLCASTAGADSAFVFSGQPIHPACVQAITMRAGDRVPVTIGLSLEGCAASERSRAEVKRDPQSRDLLYIEDEALIGEGSFGYRVLSTLDNGVFILVVRRTDATGLIRSSLAAVDLVERPGLRDGQVVRHRVLETIGEVWLENFDVMSFRTTGNVVQFVDGVGATRTERTIDLSRIARARRK